MLRNKSEGLILHATLSSHFAVLAMREEWKLVESGAQICEELLYQ